MTTLSTPKMIQLYDDFILLRHSDPGAQRGGMYTNSYAVLSDGKAVFVDAPFEELLPFIRQIAKDYTPAALLLTHRHIAHAEMLKVFEQEFGVPIFLHPIDAHHPQAAQARQAGITFQDPTKSDLFAPFDLEVQPFPGHTEESILAYWNRHGGVLLTGDAAMGPTVAQADEGMERLIRAPGAFNVDDAGVRRLWETFDKPVAGVAPFHGTVYVDRKDDIGKLMEPLTRPEPTQWMSS